MGVVGWDVGGVNTKAARVERGRLCSVRGLPFELQRAPDLLLTRLRQLAVETGATAERDVTQAVTMTAELSQAFRTKREGVAFVLDAFERAFPVSDVHVFTVDGRFVAPAEAKANPLDVAAANWSATAHLVALEHPDAVLIDVGTTTTDIIPIAGGAVVAMGLTDPGRLASGELVYTGALRTPVEAMASEVVLGGEAVGVAAEGFALAGDVHLWRGDLDPSCYTVATPDGRPATPEFAGERLARAVCADREMLDEAAISCVAAAFADAQLARVAAAIRRVVARHPRLDTAVVTGLGAFLGEAAAREAGLRVVHLATSLGDAGAQFAPAAAVALLLDRARGSGLGPRGSEQTASPEPRAASREGLTVVKIGGGLLAQPDSLGAVLGALARERRLLVVPGGGPFADAVRATDRQLHLSDDEAHWLAVLAMDQYAHVLAARVERGVLVAERSEIAPALDGGQVPVLAPSRWLREVDPLPHSWDVTSDSIAAWIAGAVGATRLVLVKPAGASGAGLVDPYFSRALPAGIELSIVTADQASGSLTKASPSNRGAHEDTSSAAAISTS